MFQAVDSGDIGTGYGFLWVLDVRKYVEKILGAFGHGFLWVCHLHNHFCFNSVSFKDGKKYNYSKAEQQRLRDIPHISRASFTPISWHRSGVTSPGLKL